MLNRKKALQMGVVATGIPRVNPTARPISSRRSLSVSPNPSPNKITKKPNRSTKRPRSNDAGSDVNRLWPSLALQLPFFYMPWVLQARLELRRLHLLSQTFT